MINILETILGAVGALSLFIITAMWRRQDAHDKRMNGFEKNYIDRFSEIKDRINQLEVNLKDEIARRYHQTAQAQQTLVLDMVQNYVNKKDCSHNNE